jgi:hypothetical protein
MIGEPSRGIRASRLTVADPVRSRLFALQDVRRWKVQAGLETQFGAAWIGSISVIVGLILGAYILFALPPVSDSTVAMLKALTAPRVGLVVLAGAMASEILVPRGQPAWRAILPATAIVWIATGLWLVWRTAPTGGGVLGGIIPWSDAADYYAGAVELANGGQITQFNMRRPLNVVLLALRLRLADGSLMGALAIGAAGAALALLVAAREVGRSVGTAAGIAFFIPCALFIAPLLPTTLSETHGLLFAALAFACLWRAALTGSMLTYGLGAFILVVANATRAGPMLIIPAVILLGALVLEPDKKLSWRAAGIGVFAAIAGFGVPLALNWLLGDGTGAFQANFSVVLYGMAVGGKDWMQAYADHPELFGPGGLEAKSSLIIYRLAFEAILADPQPFLTFYFEQLGQAWRFLWWLIPTQTLRIVAVIGALWCLVTIRHRLSLLLVLAMLGILVSAPFLIRDGGYRVFVVAMPFLAAICAYGAAAIVHIGAALLRPAEGPVAPPLAVGADRLAIASTVFVVAVVAWPLVGRGPERDPPAVDAARCGAGGFALYFEEGRWGTSLRVGREASAPRPAARWDDFTRDPEFKGINELRPILGGAKPPFDIALVVHKRHAKPEYGYAFALSAQPLPTDGPAWLCGQLASYAQTNWVGQFLLVDRVEPLARIGAR